VRKILSGLLFLVYIAIGVVVAEANDYLSDLDSIESILSLALAIILWPLVLLDVDLMIGEGTIDERPEGGGSGGGDSGGGDSGGGGSGGGGSGGGGSGGG
jgi:uncharacterized membrane protein YgcG